MEIAEDERKTLQTQLDTKLAEVDYQHLKAEVSEIVNVQIQPVHL